MFSRARRRLTWLYVGIFGVVLAIFSLAFWAVLAIVLQPDFDLASELPDEKIADIAYRTALERSGVALLASDIVAILVVSAAAWFLARRTLRPIQDATERQARFVADASHELRSPLAAIRSTAEAALINDRPQQELRAALDTVVSSTERLSRVANDLLLLARSEQGQIPADREPIDLSVVVAEALQTFTVGVSISLAEDLQVHADPTEIARLVTNLVDNGLRHGGGAVSVRTSTVGGDALVEVSDRGPGMSEEDLGHIFQPFYRARADAAAPDGSGLGLAIALSLARRNGGRLTVVSRPGAGSTFRLVLPIRR